MQLSAYHSYFFMIFDKIKEGDCMIYKAMMNRFQKWLVAGVVVLIMIAFILNPLTSGVASSIIGGLLIYFILHEQYEINQHYLYITKGAERTKVNILNIEVLNLITVKDMIYIEVVNQQRKIITKPVEYQAFVIHLLKVNPKITVQNITKQMDGYKTVSNEALQ